MLPERKQILVVDDEPNLRRVLRAQLERDGYDVHTAEDGEQALALLHEHHIDLVITDLRMPKLDGMELLRRISALEDPMPVVMITAHGTVDTAVEALKMGAFDYITKPFDQEDVRTIVRKALRTQDLSATEASRPSLVGGLEGGRYGIIGQSPNLVELYTVLDRVADTPTTVLVTGESGTGKELVGYERGAFTGAVGSKPGRFELASGGTLFLDEIGSIPVEMQVKLLRALQESEFERVGGVKTIRVDVRLVAATNSDLKREIAAGAFREDLYYRLNVVPIRLPSLRERATDIPLLAKHFIDKFNARLKKSVTGVEADTEAHLVSYPWPGNIRELENVIERAVLFSDGSELKVSDLPSEVRDVSTPEPPATQTASESAVASATDGLKEQVKAAMSRLERELIVKALDQTSSNVTHAARLLKISRKGLQLKMKELGLRERDERPES